MRKTFTTLSLNLILSLFTCYSQPTSFQIKGIGGGGQFIYPSINAGNDSEFYVPTDMGSYFHTANFGKSYTELSYQQLNNDGSNYGAVIRFTNNPKILYAIGYDSSKQVTSQKIPYSSIGSVSKSIDGGKTWNLLPCIAKAAIISVQNGVSLYVNYTNPNQLVFSTLNNLYFSNDGGNTMQDLTHFQTSPTYMNLAGCFFTGDTVIVGTTRNTLISTNGGVSFSKANLSGIDTTQDMVDFVGAEQGGKVVLFCLTIPTNTLTFPQIQGNVNGCSFVHLYKLDFSIAQTWTPRDNKNGLTVPTPGCNNCNRICRLAMAVNDTSVVYAGGTSGTAGIPIVYKTSDGANTWNSVLQTTNNQNIYTGYLGYKGDMYQWWQGFSEICVAPKNSSKVILTTLGLVITSTDGGTTWHDATEDQANEQQMGVATQKNQFHTGIGLENTAGTTISWADANTVLAGMGDIGSIRSVNGGTSWQITKSQYNTMYCTLMHPSNGLIYSCESSVHMIYQLDLTDSKIDTSSAQGAVMYSPDKGLTWDTLHNFHRPVYWIALDPNNSNRMYASVVNHTQGLGGIYVCNDIQDGASSIWTKLPNPPRTEGHPATIVPLKDGKVLCTYSCRYDNTTGHFTYSSGVFLYDPVQKTWTDLTDLNTMAWFCNDIYVDPNDSTQNTWYVGVTSGWGQGYSVNPGSPNDQGGLFKTTNRGESWAKILGTTTAPINVESCTIDPKNKDEMYVTTSGISGCDGLLMGVDINSSTPTFSNVQGFVFCSPMRVFFNPYNQKEMWVMTTGNGIHVGYTPSITAGINELNPQASGLSLYPNPANNKVQLHYSNYTKPVVYAVFDILGKSVGSGIMKEATYQLDVANFNPGVYFVRVDGRTEKLVVN